VTRGFLALISVLALGCAQLPEGWEGSRSVPVVEMRACEANNGEDRSPGLDSYEPTAGTISFLLEDGLIACDYEFEGWYKDVDDGYEVLAQPAGAGEGEISEECTRYCDVYFELTSMPSGPFNLGLYHRFDSTEEPMLAGAMSGTVP
jgi:hypothetical protein